MNKHALRGLLAAIDGLARKRERLHKAMWALQKAGVPVDSTAIELECADINVGINELRDYAFKANCIHPHLMHDQKMKELRELAE